MVRAWWLPHTVAGMGKHPRRSILSKDDAPAKPRLPEGVLDVTNFGSSNPFTVGVEEELQILDPETGDLVARIDEVLGKASDENDQRLQSELFQAVVETATPICEDIDEVREEVTDLRDRLVDHCEDRGYAIAAASTHPTAHWQDQAYTDKERYAELIETVQWPAKRELIFGVHVHVAVEHPQQAIFVNNHFRPFLPLILGLSTNSPFWKGEATGLKATRPRIFDALPRSGVPRAFQDFADYNAAVGTFKAVGSIDDVTTIWWDIRPRPDLGTVEMRIPDIPTEVDVTVALAGLTQAIVKRLADAWENGESPPLCHNVEVIRENRWRAIRDGIDADLIQVEDGNVEAVPFKNAVDSMFSLLGDAPEELGLQHELQLLQDLVERGETGAERQLRIYEETDDFLPVIQDIVERTPPGKAHLPKIH